jgi:hypothetical protein
MNAPADVSSLRRVKDMAALSKKLMSKPDRRIAMGLIFDD